MSEPFDPQFVTITVAAPLPSNGTRPRSRCAIAQLTRKENESIYEFAGAVGKLARMLVIRNWQPSAGSNARGRSDG